VAMLYLKPHANTAAAQLAVRSFLERRGMRIVKEAGVDANAMHYNAYKFEKQYSVIAKRAVHSEPAEISLTAASFVRFQKKFGLSWAVAVSQNRVKNAASACEYLEMDIATFTRVWIKCMQKNLYLQFGRGLCVGYIDSVEGKDAIFVINGFFFGMRSEYQCADSQLHCFSVEFDADAIPWSVFRSNILGSSDPLKAHPDSLRRHLASLAKSLELRLEPSILHNCIHGSSSAFEAIAEHALWFGSPITSIPFANRLLSSGIPATVIKEWLDNPIVKGRRVYDHMESLGCDDCEIKARELYSVAEAVHFPARRSMLGRGTSVSPLTVRTFAAEPEATNHAFLFIKPLANTPATQTLVRDWLLSKNFRIVGDGSLKGGQIEKGALFDKHYADIARRAVLLKPNELSVSAAAFVRFQKKFGSSWTKAIEQGSVFNAVDALSRLDANPAGLCDAWLQSYAQGRVVKFERGFYCGELTCSDGNKIYCVNGFYLAMRSRFVNKDATIKYYLLEWEEAMFSFESFRKLIIGVSDPSRADPGSLRGTIFSEWRSLDLRQEPNVLHNAIHASASAFEGLVERINWLKRPVATDPFGSQLITAGVPLQCIKDWCSNPLIQGRTLFHHMEGKSSPTCIARAKELLALYDESGALIHTGGTPKSLPPITPSSSTASKVYRTRTFGSSNITNETSSQEGTPPVGRAKFRKGLSHGERDVLTDNMQTNLAEQQKTMAVPQIRKLPSRGEVPSAATPSVEAFNRKASPLRRVNSRTELAARRSITRQFSSLDSFADDLSVMTPKAISSAVASSKYSPEDAKDDYEDAFPPNPLYDDPLPTRRQLEAIRESSSRDLSVGSSKITRKPTRSDSRQQVLSRLPSSVVPIAEAPHMQRQESQGADRVMKI